MKKILVILLLVCYLIPAIGLSVTEHYCGGKLASVSVVFADNAACKCGKKMMKKDCCKDKTVTFKLKDTQNFTKTLASNFSKSFKFLVHNFPVCNYNFTEVAFERHTPFAHPPPLQKSEPLFLLNRVFLI